MMHRPLPLSRIHSSIASDWSLNAIDVESRRIQYGQNDILESTQNRWLTIAKDTASDTMIWFLIVTSFLFALLKNYNQTLILLLATIPLIGMDAFLHWRTQISTQHLKGRLSTHAIVIRNGIEISILTEDLVPGDLIVISTGKLIPAD